MKHHLHRAGAFVLRNRRNIINGLAFIAAVVDVLTDPNRPSPCQPIKRLNHSPKKTKRR